MEEEYIGSPFELHDTMDAIPETTRNIANIQLDCPLCGSIVRFHFTNYHDQYLMCVNEDCDYPFGYKELQWYKGSDYRSIGGSTSSKSTTVPSNSASTVSSQVRADIEQMNTVYEADECQSDIRSMNEYKDKNLKKLMEIECQDRLLKNMKNIKELNVALSEVNEQNDLCLSNEKWIKHLLNFQRMSGIKLVKQGEMKRLNNTDICLDSKLKIDVDSTNNNGSSITIELAKE